MRQNTFSQASGWKHPRSFPRLGNSSENVYTLLNTKQHEHIKVNTLTNITY